MLYGKIKESDISVYVKSAFQTCIKQLNCIAIEDFINLFDTTIKKYTNLKKLLNLPHYLGEFSKKSKENSETIFQLYSASHNFKNLVQLNYLITQKKQLLKELEISKTYEKEIAISTITELINDLEENVRDNQKKLNYFEEDYIKRKNQIESIKNDISKYQNQITNLNQAKKSFFNEINKITRNMEKILEENPKKDKTSDKIESSLNSEKIRQLQNSARESQYQINQLRAKIDEKKTMIARLEPQFKIFEKDHNEIITAILNDEARIKELKEKLNYELQERATHLGIDNQEITEINIRSKKEIETKISQIEQRLTQVEIPKDYFNPQKPEDFSNIQSEISKLANKVKNKKKHMQIPNIETEISQVIYQYETFENLIEDMESLIGLFLSQINLKTKFLITIDNVEESLFLEILFTRNEKNRLKFENLTTPEKIFFVIIFYISIEILNNSRHIIFSNFFLPNNYNKRGSIERTIRKIIPLFNIETRLSDIKIVFVIANLDIRSDFKNIKLIKIEEG